MFCLLMQNQHEGGRFRANIQVFLSGEHAMTLAEILSKKMAITKITNPHCIRSSVNRK